MNKPIIIPPSLSERARHLCEIMYEVSGIDAMAKTRKRPVVMARVMVVNALLSEGHSENSVGVTLGFDHSTINHYRKKLDDILTLRCYDAEREIWKKFNEKIQTKKQMKELLKITQLDNDICELNIGLETDEDAIQFSAALVGAMVKSKRLTVAILTALAAIDKHGEEIIKDAQDATLPFKPNSVRS